jgi:hypothetical protein
MKLRISIIIALTTFLIKFASSQSPEAVIETPVPSGTCSNLTVQFNGYATASAVGTSFTFNGGSLPAGWSSTPYTVGQPCWDSVDTPDGSNYFWASDVAGERYVETNNLDASLGEPSPFCCDLAMMTLNRAVNKLITEKVYTSNIPLTMEAVGQAIEKDPNPLGTYWKKNTMNCNIHQINNQRLLHRLFEWI